MYRPAKVGNLQLSPETKQEVFWFDITMDHLLLMAILQGIRQLLHVLLRIGDMLTPIHSTVCIQGIRGFRITVEHYSLSSHSKLIFNNFWLLITTQSQLITNQSQKHGTSLSPWQYAGHQIGHNAAIPCTFHLLKHIPGPGILAWHHGSSCRNEEYWDAFKWRGTYLLYVAICKI